MNERAFYQESNTTKPITLNCPFCGTADSYDLRWMLRRKRDRLPPNADDRDRAKFAKAQSYMVLLDDKVACKNLRCRKRFDISGVKTTAFLSPEQEAGADHHDEAGANQRQEKRDAQTTTGRDTGGRAGAGRRRRKHPRARYGRGRHPDR